MGKYLCSVVLLLHIENHGGIFTDCLFAWIGNTETIIMYIRDSFFEKIRQISSRQILMRYCTHTFDLLGNIMDWKHLMKGEITIYHWVGERYRTKHMGFILAIDIGWIFQGTETIQNELSTDTCSLLGIFILLFVDFIKHFSHFPSHYSQRY